jgi:hypothetical protein
MIEVFGHLDAQQFLHGGRESGFAKKEAVAGQRVA